MSNIIKAICHGRTIVRTPPLYQYDYGQILQLVGVELPNAYEVHFSNQPHGQATTQIGDADGVIIPDQYLLSGAPVYAWLYLHTGTDDGETEISITIPVLTRAQPTDQEPTPVQQDVITQAIAALNTAVETTAQDVTAAAGAAELAEGSAELANQYMQAAQEAQTDAEAAQSAAETAQEAAETAQSNAEGYATDAAASAQAAAQSATSAEQSKTAAQSAAESVAGAMDSLEATIAADLQAAKESGEFDGPPGEPGTDGISPAATVTKSGKIATITITDKDGTTTAQISDGADGAPGTPGTNGSDGFSPTATVSKSGTTATITITDKNGTTTAQVQDGAKGDPGDDYVLTAQDKEDIAGMVDVPVQDVQVNGTSVLSNGVANVPIASLTSPGLVELGGALQFISGGGSKAYLNGSSENAIKAGTNGFFAITPLRADACAFYGLAKVAGSDEKNSALSMGTYTEAAKSAISQMLNAPETVSGTTPTIVAKAGIRYVCGEVSTLDFTPSATGICDVVFTSGSTATVLTVPNTVKWPAWFDPTALEANTTYELNIMNGTLGAVGVWN